MKFRPLLLLSILSLPSLATLNAQDQEACVQVAQTAVSPSGICQEFANPCIVPSDWKAVPSCDLVSSTDSSSKTTLESKMNNRISLMRAYWDKKKAEKETDETSITNKNFNRIGSGSFTKTTATARQATSTAPSTAGIRAFTEKDYSSDVAKRYSLRGGYQREDDTTSEERQARRAYTPPRISSSEGVRTGDLNTTVKWDVLSRQFTTNKSYGPNPYTVRSQYIADQKEARDATNQEVDVYERLMSRQRVYRGERMEGNLDGSSLLEEGLIDGQEVEEE